MLRRLLLLSLLTLSLLGLTVAAQDATPKRVVAYFISWGIYERAYKVTDIPGDLDTAVLALPHHWGIFLDVSALSIVAPLNEEFWQGMLVGFFFFRYGNAARCFVPGLVAGTGFTLF